MKIVVRASANQKKELLDGIKENNKITFVDSFKETDNLSTTDAIIDLKYEDDPSSLADLKNFLPRCVIINSVINTVSEIENNFIRINGWEGFLLMPLWEGSFIKEEYKNKAETVLDFLGKKIIWVPDQPGFVSPRIISTIINEAFLAYKEGVSTEEEIDSAMKLGTNYPYGPFEWAERIGNEKIQKLLMTLGKK